jgi:hypothetical protein
VETNKASQLFVDSVRVRRRCFIPFRLIYLLVSIVRSAGFVFISPECAEIRTCCSLPVLPVRHTDKTRNDFFISAPKCELWGLFKWNTFKAINLTLIVSTNCSLKCCDGGRKIMREDEKLSLTYSLNASYYPF